MKKVYFVLLVCFTFKLSAQDSFWGDLVPGSYDVGYRTIAISDTERTYNGQPRPLLLSVWFPASLDEASDRVLFEDYLFTEGAKVSMQSLNQAQKDDVSTQFIKKIAERGADTQALKDLLKLSTKAIKNESVLNETFPLLISLQGGGRPAYTNFILNEYLASHGYLVASFQDIYASPNRRENSQEQNMEALGKDISLAIAKLKSMPEFSISRIGSLGFSRAGGAILFHQVNEGNLDAIVTLDGQPGNQLVEILGSDQLEDINIPVMAFFSNHQNKLSLESAQADSLAFEFLPNSDRLKFRMMELNHGDQTSSGMIASHLVKNYNRWPLIGDAKLGYETICRLTKAFFDRYLKNITSASQILDNPHQELGLTEEFLVVHRIEKK